MEETTQKPTKAKHAVLFGAIAILLLGGSFYAGYSQRKVTVKEVTKTEIRTVFQDKIVEKEKIVVKWRQAKNVVVTKHEETRPDGTVVKDTTIKDNSVTSNNTNVDTTKTETVVQNTTQIVTQIKEVKTEVLPDWFIQLGAGVSINNPQLGNLPRSGIYSVSVSRRILWSCYLGMQGQSDALFNNPVLMTLAGCGF